MRKNKIIAALLAGTMLTALTACNSSSPMAGKGEATSNTDNKDTKTIQFWNSFTGTDGDVLREVVEQYNKDNKNGYKVEMDIMPAANLEEKLPAAITTKTAPALVIKGNFDAPTYGKNKTFIAVDDFFEQTGTKKDDFDTNALSALQYDGKQMMIPMQVHSTFLFWNKDLFKGAGLDPETPPKTWDEVKQFSEKITNASKKIYGVGLPVSGAPCYFDGMFKSNGGDVISEDGKSSVLNSDQNKKTLEYIQGLAKAGQTPKGATGADTDNLMLAGQLGIYVSGPWLINGLKENKINYGVTAMPAGSNGAKGVIEVQGFGVTSSATDAQKKIAYDFMAYWNTTEVCKKWSIKNGYPPYLKSVAADSEVKSDETVKALSSITDFGFTFAPGIAAASQINSDVLFPLIENVEAGNDVAKELKTASDKVDGLLKK